MFLLLMPKIMMMYEIKPTTRPVKRIIEKFAQKDYNFKLVYHEKLSVLYVSRIHTGNRYLNSKMTKRLVPCPNAKNLFFISSGRSLIFLTNF